MKIKKTVISSFGESSSSFRPGVKTLFHKVSFFLRHTVLNIFFTWRWEEEEGEEEGESHNAYGIRRHH